MKSQTLRITEYRKIDAVSEVFVQLSLQTLSPFSEEINSTASEICDEESIRFHAPYDRAKYLLAKSEKGHRYPWIKCVCKLILRNDRVALRMYRSTVENLLGARQVYTWRDSTIA